jgi:phage portal protein BeeE
MSTEARDEIQRDFKNAYGFQPDQSQIIITDAALQWQSMSFNATELGLNETYKRATFDIATGLGYPKDLLQLEGSTFNNQNTAWKSLYQDTVIPMAESYCMQLMELLRVDTSKVLIKKTYDHLEVMQESNEEKGKGLKAITEAAEMQFNLNAITFNQMLEMIGQKPITDGNRYKYQMSEVYENTNQTRSGEGDTPEES